MNDKVRSYYRLKQKQKDIEQELSELRQEIIAYCEANGTNEGAFGSYNVKITPHLKKEYDENKLFEALPDLELWRLLSSPDTGKIAGLVKLNVISEERIKDAFTVKDVLHLHVEKK